MSDEPTNRRLFKRQIVPGVNIDVKQDVDRKVRLTGVNQAVNLELGDSLQRAIQSKLVRDKSVTEIRNHETRDEWLTRASNLNTDYFLKTAKQTAQNVTDANTILDSLPDIELTKEIVIASILSPNDIMSTELFYTCKNSMFSSVTPHLLKVIKDYFNNTYKINRKLRMILEKALFVEGSYTWIVLPESSVDHVINSNLKITHESLKDIFYTNGNTKTIGILGSATADKKGGIFVGLEDEKENHIDPRVGNPATRVTVTDNFNALKQPWIQDYNTDKSLETIFGDITMGLEDFKPYLGVQGNEKDVSNIYPERSGVSRTIVSVSDPDELDKPTVGHPAVINPPTESVIPVFKPSDPTTHVGYFIAVDEFGNPLKLSTESSQFNQMRNAAESIKTLNGAMIAQTSSASISGVDQRDQPVDIRVSSQLYANVIEQDLIARLKNGIYKSNITLGESSKVYQMMFWRALRNMQTRLIYVPVKLTTYLAFDYHDNGVGRSILDKTKSLSSLRMVNQVGEALAAIKSSIDHRELDIKLDPNDPHPMRTIEKYKHEYQRATMSEAPFGLYSMTDITDSIQSAGVHVKISGHEGVPDMGMEVSNMNLGFSKPDSDYDEKLQKKHIMGMGAPPESITSTEQVQFAASVISQNAFFAKINLTRQEILSDALSDFIAKYTKSSSVLRGQLTSIVKKNLDTLRANGIPEQYDAEAIALVFINNIRIELPKPDTAQLEAQSKAFDDYAAAFDKVMDTMINANLFSEKWVGAEISGMIDDIIPIIKGHYLREYAIKNNFLPELFKLISHGEEDSEQYDVLEQFTVYLESIIPSMKKFIIKRMKAAQSEDGVINAAKELLGADEDDSSSDDSSSDDSSDEGDEGGDDDMFGGDDFGDGSDETEGDGAEEGEGENEEEEPSDENDGEEGDDSDSDNNSDDEFSL